ncbi:MAG: NAD-dependent epimerase/dehydratase family protein [Bdellovibrio sp.]
MKFLVTGATGFLGQNLIQYLYDSGHQAVALVREGSRPPASLLNLAVEISRADVTAAPSLQKIPENLDGVFHLAGVIAYHKRERALMERVNVQGTVHVLDFCETRALPLLHVSSVVAVGASRTPVVLNETSPYEVPNSFGYFASKRKAESLVLQRSLQGKLRAVVVNPSTIYGAGDMEKSSRKAQLQVARGRLNFYPPGGVSVVNVEAVVHAMLKALQIGKSGERYILAGENLLLKEVFALIAKHSGQTRPKWGLPQVLLQIIGLGGDLAELFGFQASLTSENAALACWYHWFDSSKARQELGFQFESADEAIRKSILWAKKNGLLC